MEKDIKFKQLLEDIVEGAGCSEDRPGFWIASGYSFKNDGKKIYVEVSIDKTKELEYKEIDPFKLREGKIEILK